MAKSGRWINGGWLVIVVATQSVSILTVLMVPSFISVDFQKPLMFTALVRWLSGGALYLWLTTLIFFRYTFLPMSAEEFTSPYWINMGSVAISTLAGATLLGQSGLSPVVAELEPFLKGLTLFFWSVGSWWIPLLIVLGVWRYLICGVPFAYNPLYWGGVFPLGMYSVCTYRLVKIVDASFLMPVSFAFMIVAVAAWMAAFIGLVNSRLNVSTRGTCMIQELIGCERCSAYAALLVAKRDRRGHISRLSKFAVKCWPTKGPCGDRAAQ